MALPTDGTAAVTGAGRGLGLAIVLELLHRGMPTLALVEREEMIDDVRAATRELEAQLTVDVLDVRRAVEVSLPADLRVLVNNAGRRTDYLPVEEIASADWRAVFEVNVLGMVEVTRRAIPILRAGTRGAVICNVTSSAVVDLPPFMGAYRASKAAVSALSETLRLELAPFNVRVVEVMPGPTHTAMAAGGVTTRPAEAIAYPPYAPMAERQFAVHRELPGLTPAAAAAMAVVDAIADDRGTMRHGTDAVSDARLEWWRSRDDESRMQEAFSRYLGVAGNGTAALRGRAAPAPAGRR